MQILWVAKYELRNQKGGGFVCMWWGSFERNWLRTDYNVIGFGLIGWIAPSSIPAIDGKSLTGLFFESIGAELAHFPTPPALTSQFWLVSLMLILLLSLGSSVLFWKISPLLTKQVLVKKLIFMVKVPPCDFGQCTKYTHVIFLANITITLLMDTFALKKLHRYIFALYPFMWSINQNLVF